MARGIRGYSMDIHFLPTFSFRSVYTDYPKNSRTNLRTQTKSTASTAFAAPLGHLICPDFSEQQQQHYLQGCSGLWETIRANPEVSVLFQQAHRKLVALKAFLMATGKAIQAASHRAPPAPANRIHTLIQQTSGARPIPIWADFAAGISTFHERAQSSTSHASVSEISFGSLDDANGKLTEESVAVALTFLGCNITSTTADEIEAVWILLGVQEGTRDELEEFLLSASR